MQKRVPCDVCYYYHHFIVELKQYLRRNKDRNHFFNSFVVKKRFPLNDFSGKKFLFVLQLSLFQYYLNSYIAFDKENETNHYITPIKATLKYDF